MKTLVVIDMQNDFIDGPLGTQEAVAIVPRVQKKIEEYVTSGNNVIFTRDTHGSNYLNTNEGKHLPVIHCVHNTHGWCIHKDIQSQFGTIIIDKPTFGHTEWEAFSDLLYVDEIELVGVCTDICVVSNALILKAVYPEVNITVDASCCAGVTPESHMAALATMKMCQINVIGEDGEQL